MPNQQELEARIAALEAMLTGQGMEVEKVQVPAPPEVVDLAPVGYPEPRDPIVNPPYDSDLAPVEHPPPLTPVLNPPQDLAPVVERTGPRNHRTPGKPRRCHIQNWRM